MPSSTASQPAPESAGALTDLSLPRLLSLIEEGLPTDLVEETREELDLGTEEMAQYLGLSARTLDRRLEKGRLGSAESERLYRLLRLFHRAEQVLGSPSDARTWLKTSQMRLGDRIPLELARYEPGAREVERLLGRIEHGIPA